MLFLFVEVEQISSPNEMVSTVLTIQILKHRHQMSPSATLIESVVQPSNASIISSSNTSGISTVPALSSRVT